MLINKHVLPKAGTPLPSNIRKKAENQSGISLADIRVNYESKEPAYFNAHAITYGKNIYLCPGKSNYLEHEVGHAIQQKVTQVSSTGLENGLPVNENTSVEQKAVPENYIGYQARSSFRPVVQKAKVSVTLSVLNDNLFNASDVIVDTINLPNRFTTSLTGKAQGDHTIADVLFKRSQKHAVMGKNLANALVFYEKNVSELLTLANSDPNTNKETMKLCADAIKIINNNREALPLNHWNIMFKRIIQYYNEAWALSTYSTTIGPKSGGRNEGGAMKDLANGKYDYSTLYHLLDLYSVSRIKNVDEQYEHGDEGYRKKQKNTRDEFINSITAKKNELYRVNLEIFQLSGKVKSDNPQYKTKMAEREKLSEYIGNCSTYNNALLIENTIGAYLIDKTIDLINLEHQNRAFVEGRLNLKKELQNSHHIYSLIALFKQDYHMITKIRSILLVYLGSNGIGHNLVSEDLEIASQKISFKVSQKYDEINQNENSDQSESLLPKDPVSNFFNYYIKKLESRKDDHNKFIEKCNEKVPFDDYHFIENKCADVNSCIDVFITQFQEMISKNFVNYDTTYLLTDATLENIIDDLHIMHINALDVQ